MVIQKLQQEIALFLLVSDDVASDCCIVSVGPKKGKDESPTLRVHKNRFLASSLPEVSVCKQRYPKLKNAQDVSESGDVSKLPAPSAQCYLGSCYSELARVLRSKRQPSLWSC